MRAAVLLLMAASLAGAEALPRVARDLIGYSERKEASTFQGATDVQSSDPSSRPRGAKVRHGGAADARRCRSSKAHLGCASRFKQDQPGLCLQVLSWDPRIFLFQRLLTEGAGMCTGALAAHT
jgi:hypothetical protein